MSKKPRIHLVSDTDKAHASGPQPLATLGKAGRTLWDQIAAEFDISDINTRAMLSLICESTDRAARLRAAIDATGEVIMIRGVPKAHPAIRDEIACRAFIARTLARMGLEPTVSRGRPGGANCGYTGPEEYDE
jgi:hypothetical protein